MPSEQELMKEARRHVHEIDKWCLEVSADYPEVGEGDIHHETFVNYLETTVIPNDVRKILCQAVGYSFVKGPTR